MPSDPWPDVPGTIISACDTIEDVFARVVHGVGGQRAFALGQALGYLRRDADWLRAQLASPAAEPPLTAEQVELLYDECRAKAYEDEQRLSVRLIADTADFERGMARAAAAGTRLDACAEPPSEETRAALVEVFEAARRAYDERHPEQLVDLGPTPSSEVVKCHVLTYDADIWPFIDGESVPVPSSCDAGACSRAAVGWHRDTGLGWLPVCSEHDPHVLDLVALAADDEHAEDAAIAERIDAAHARGDYDRTSPHDELMDELGLTEPEPASLGGEADLAQVLADDPAVIEPQPAKKKRNLSDAERERRRQSAYAMTERKRVLKATPDQLTTCHICDEPRLKGGEHTCRRGKSIASIPRDDTPTVDSGPVTCGHQLAGTMGPIPCTHEPHVDGPHSWETTSPIETTARPAVPGPPKRQPLADLTPEARAQIDALWDRAGAR